VRVVMVDAEIQELSVREDGIETFRCPVSTGKAGLGCQDGSGKTPVGWHRVAELIGDGAPLGARFASREPTGEVWTGGPVEGDWITTRIFWLEGLEPGVNKGPGVDTHDRYIYLHGTPHEDELGAAASHGCVRMSNQDAARLSEIVRPGDPVWIGPRCVA
jgi:lipoprotein-anchoring transpeptidase ErfK/SrfK